MSAVLAPVESPTWASGSRLRPLPRTRGRLARLPFLIVLAVMVALGMVGVLVLSVQLQQRADQLSNLRSQDAELSYQEASLQTQVEQLSSVTQLSHRAWQLGMRPNPAPVFINLRTGAIIGTPTRVTGHEMLDQSGASIYNQDAGIVAARTKAMAPKPTPKPTPTPAPQGLPTAPPVTAPSAAPTAASKPAGAQSAQAKPLARATASAHSTASSSGGH